MWHHVARRNCRKYCRKLPKIRRRVAMCRYMCRCMIVVSRPDRQKTRDKERIVSVSDCVWHMQLQSIGHDFACCPICRHFALPIMLGCRLAVTEPYRTHQNTIRMKHCTAHHNSIKNIMPWSVLFRDYGKPGARSDCTLVAGCCMILYICVAVSSLHIAAGD